MKNIRPLNHFFKMLDKEIKKHEEELKKKNRLGSSKF
jgi:hypothetical protein